VKRYELILSNEYEYTPQAEMSEDKAGEYVEYEEYQLLEKRIVELENIPTHVFTRRPFRPHIDTPDKQESYTKGFEDALKEVQFNIDKNKGGAE